MNIPFWLFALVWFALGFFIILGLVMRTRLWAAQYDATVHRQLVKDLERGVERNVEPRTAIIILRPAFVAAGIESEAVERLTSRCDDP